VTLRKITDGLSARSLSLLVGFDVAAFQEHEQLVAAVDIHRVSQLALLGVGWLEREQPLKFSFETAAMRGNGGVGEIGPAAADPTRVLEQRVCTENFVRVDDVTKSPSFVGGFLFVSVLLGNRAIPRACKAL
jgi:hypothetical protein